MRRQKGDEQFSSQPSHWLIVVKKQTGLDVMTQHGLRSYLTEAETFNDCFIVEATVE